LVRQALLTSITFRFWVRHHSGRKFHPCYPSICR